jgi:hypothetical protein
MPLMPIPIGYRLTLAFAALALLVGCASTQGRFAPLGERHTAKPADAYVAVFESGVPGCGFERVARLDAHLEKTGLMPSSLSEALVVLRKQARLAGGDGIVEIKEQRSQLLETRIYHVTATAIRCACARCGQP